MDRFFHILLAVAASALLASPLAACAAAGKEPELVVLVHDSFDISSDVVEAFETQHKAKVTFLKSGDAGQVLNKAILSAGHPLGDLLYGVDNTFLSRALEYDLFEAYSSPALSAIPRSLILDPTHHLLPVDWGDVCLNYDVAWYERQGLEPPAALEDLIAPQYRGQVVVENPATSSPGLAFLLATVARFGEDGYRDYWRALRENEVRVESGWTAAYYGQFTAASEGDRPIVVSYATSPAAEVYNSEGKYQVPPTGAVTSPGACFRQVEFVGILKGSKQPALARAFVDWMLGVTFQEDIPLHMWVYPANQDAALPQVFLDFAHQAVDPATLPPEAIAVGREDWIEGWTEEVLR
ncbi:MAG: thiamine ABC transporter substrate-binding protein [Anaerolineae bacterium]|nr:thiamine ABC transporter substrate-binding protein [Anaerolineae bacterium]